MPTIYIYLLLKEMNPNCLDNDDDIYLPRLKHNKKEHITSEQKALKNRNSIENVPLGQRALRSFSIWDTVKATA